MRLPNRRQAALMLSAAVILFAVPDVRAEDADPRVLPKSEFDAMAIESLQSANGVSRERAAKRFADIMEAARTFPGSSNMAKQVRTGHSHYEKSANIRKKHASMILSLFTDAHVADMSPKEANAILSAWPTT